MLRFETMSRRPKVALRAVGAIAGALLLGTPGQEAAAKPAQAPAYEREDTRELVRLVDDAAGLVAAEGERAFDELRVSDSRWRRGERYVFVLDAEGNMLVHPDPALEGENQLELRDVNGRSIVRGLLSAVTAKPDQPAGWYHYEWPVPNGLLPRWKSSYARLVTAPSGARYLVGSGMYDDRMERAFAVDMVQGAVGRLEAEGEAAFPLLRDRKGPFMAKDAYVFVLDPATGVELVNPAHPSLEGRNLLDVEDTHGKKVVRDMIDVVGRQGSGWVEYMWPKPGDSVSTLKSSYVTTAEVGGRPLLVGAGVYLADAPEAPLDPDAPTAAELVALVNDAAAVFAERGERSFSDFRERGSRWFQGDTYLFVWTLDGQRVFHAADPSLEGRDASRSEDALGRPYGQMFLDVARSGGGEGWVHYMYPEPGGLFPAWKSSYLKRVESPSGDAYLIGSGIYHMQMNRAFIEDLVDRAAALVAQQGEAAFPALRDPRGPFVFMDTYVFVTAADGTELVNAGQPSLEGKNLLGVEDIEGKPLVRYYLDAARTQGAAWVEYYWYAPGDNEPARKESFVREVEHGGKSYVVGAGFYLDEPKPRAESDGSVRRAPGQRVAPRSRARSSTATFAQ